MTGLCHGHIDVTKTKDESVILKREKGAVVANAKLKSYTVITQDNLESFHFHGDQLTFPATSALVVPNDEKSKIILFGRYQAHPKNMQLIQPRHFVQELILSILRIKPYARYHYCYGQRFDADDDCTRILVVNSLKGKRNNDYFSPGLQPYGDQWVYCCRNPYHCRCECSLSECSIHADMVAV